MYIIPGVMGGGGEMQRDVYTTRGDGKTQKERLGQRKREIHIHTRGDGRKRQREMYVLE